MALAGFVCPQAISLKIVCCHPERIILVLGILKLPGVSTEHLILIFIKF